LFCIESIRFFTSVTSALDSEIVRLVTTGPRQRWIRHIRRPSPFPAHQDFNQVAVINQWRQNCHIAILVENDGANGTHDQLLQRAVVAEKTILTEGVPDKVFVLQHLILLSITGFSRDFVALSSDGAALTGSRPVGKHVGFAGNVLADFLLETCVTGHSPPMMP
jgi:hypothetical protein